MKNKLLSFLAAISLMIPAARTQAQTIFGLTSSSDIFMMADANNPSSISGPYNITGMTTGQMLVGIDYNPHDAMLYALAYDSTTTKAQLYTINTNTWAATAVSSSAMTMDLGNGKNVGFNFIATMSDHIRVVAGNGNNYIMSATDGSITATGSTSLSYAMGDVNYGASAMVATTTYLNSFYGADATEELGFDMAHSTIVTFDANDMTKIHTMSISGLSLHAGSTVSMDASYDTSSNTNTIYLTAQPSLASGATLYKVNTGTGVLVSVGAIGSGSIDVRGITVKIDNTIPTTVSGQLAFGLTLNQRHLVTFDTKNPRIIRNDITLSGMASGQVMMAIAFNPIDMQLYGLGYDTAMAKYQLYVIDTVSGNLTAVNSTAASLNMGTSGSTDIGFAYNPMGGYFRVTGDAGLNAEISATSGMLMATDSAMTYASSDINFGTSAYISSIAYTNSYKGTTTSSMVGVDYNTGAMIKLDAGSKHVIKTLLDISSIIGLGVHTDGHVDFYYDSTSSSDMGYMATNIGGNSSSMNNYAKFYMVSSGSAGLTSDGEVGPGVPVKSMALRKPYSGTTSISTVSNSNAGLLVYPNPVVGQTSIVLPQEAKTKVYVDVIDLDGRTILSKEYSMGSHKLDLNMSNVPTGIYSIRIMHDNVMQQVKVVKH